jgi:hypothetical protein
MKTLIQVAVGLFFMASIVAAPALLVSPAEAGFNCTKIGTFTNCNDYSSGQSVVCSQIGDFLSCN